MNHISWSTALAYILARLKEKSTWAGIAAFLVGCGFIKTGSPLVDQLPQIGVIVGGLLAAVVPTKPTAVTSGIDPASTVKASALLAFTALALLASPLLGGCVWTLSTGQQVVLTPSNLIPLVLDKLKTGCASYDKNKVTDDALIGIATQLVNNPKVNTTTATVEQIATAGCPLVEALISTPSAPAATAPSQ